MVSEHKRQQSTHWRSQMAALAVSFAALPCNPAGAREACSGLMAAGAPAAGHGAKSSGRPVSAGDLLTLRDIGQPDGSAFSSPSPIAISPDGRHAALVLNQADPNANAYCRGLVVIDLTGKQRPRLIDQGGELITARIPLRGLLLAGGWQAVVTPVWSPDGTLIAYLRKDDGRTQVWLTRSDGSGAHVLTKSSVDVEAVAWSGKNGRIVFLARASLEAQNEGVATEGRNGWLYDGRFMPNIAARPLASDVPLVAYSIGVDGKNVREAISEERALVKDAADDDLAGPKATANDGRIASTRKAGPIEPLVLTVTDHERTIRCEEAACSGNFTGIWWDGAGKDLIYLRREGWARNEMGLYRWDPGSGRAPTRILHTSAALLGCLPSHVWAATDLICLSENGTQPRRLVRIDSRSGLVRTLFDPNPEFASLTFGKVERLYWTNAIGLKAWGDLVLPPGYRGKSRLPLIVVQYHSSGFLRGGTGDEYPVHALAAAGFAVLSVEADVLDPQVFPGIRSWPELNARLMKDWTERRAQLSSLETAVGQVVERGIADPKRIGITGLSAGASSARFALINSKLFSVAALSTCCMEEQAVQTYSGIRLAEDFALQGYPAAGKDPGDFWKTYSLAVNSRHIEQPMLMQLSDDEYLLALEPYTALKAAGKPVEMYVYPGEYHVKWQPAHRAAIYERNIDWFAFWFENRIDPKPAKREQYRRWQALRGVTLGPGSN